jgi:hypothetical protein
MTTVPHTTPLPPEQRELHRWRWFGFAGSALLGVSALGAGVLPQPDRFAESLGLSVLRTQPGLGICIVLAVVGMAILALAWWQLRSLRGMTVRWATITAAWWALPLALAPPLFSRDMYSYAAQGDLLANGVDPYLHGPAALPSRWLESVSVTWYNTPAPYGPLFLWLAKGAAEIAGTHLIVALLLLRLTALIGVALTAVALPRLARACGVDPVKAQWLAIANPLLLAHFVSGGHNDALMVGFLVAGLAFAVSRRGGWAAACIALAAAVKVPAVLALPFVALLWAPRFPRHQRLVLSSVATGAVAVGTFVTVSTMAGLGLGWVHALKTPGAIIQWTSIPTGVGTVAGWIVAGLGRPDLVMSCIDSARALGLSVTLILLALLWRHAYQRASLRWRVPSVTESPENAQFIVALFCACLVAINLLGPIFHPWYGLWFLIPMAAVAKNQWFQRGVAVASVALTFFILPADYNIAPITQVPGSLLDLALVSLAIVVLIHRYGETLRRPTAVLAAVWPATRRSDLAHGWGREEALGEAVRRALRSDEPNERRPVAAESDR